MQIFCNARCWDETQSTAQYLKLYKLKKDTTAGSLSSHWNELRKQSQLYELKIFVMYQSSKYCRTTFCPALNGSVWLLAHCEDKESQACLCFAVLETTCIMLWKGRKASKCFTADGDTEHCHSFQVHSSQVRFVCLHVCTLVCMS